MDNIDIIMLNNLEDILEVKIMDMEEELTELRLQLASTRKVLVRKEQEMTVERAIEDITPKNINNRRTHNRRTWDNPEGL
jgi:CO dehydrogenase/acetyl-CoA synthase delta subunit